MNNIETFFGRLLVLLLYCSIFFSTNIVLTHHKMQISKKKAELFVAEVLETGVQEDLCLAFVSAQASLGYIVEFSLESKTRPMNNQEIFHEISTAPLVIGEDEFFTCRLSSGKYVLRVGG